MVNSIPKAGTFLVIELLKAFGFQGEFGREMPEDSDELEPGRYYNLQHMTREHLARPSHRIGRFVNEFCRNPVVFMVRDPRDVAASLAHYLSVQTDYHLLQSYFSRLSPERRLLAVIEGDYPVPVYINRHMRFSGTIRDLFLAYADWIRHPLPNTVVLRFEELVGPRGGGGERVQQQAVWEAQLALHVPGSPAQFADNVFSTASYTFHKGQIGSYRNDFGAAHWKAFESLPADFLELFGYGSADPARGRDRLWRGFQGEIEVHSVREHPQLVEQDYRNFNLIAYDGKVWGAAMAAGPIDFWDTEACGRMLADGRLLQAATVEGVRAAVDRLCDREATAAELAVLRSQLESLASRVDELSLGIEQLRETVTSDPPPDKGGQADEPENRGRRNTAEPKRSHARQETGAPDRAEGSRPVPTRPETCACSDARGEPPARESAPLFRRLFFRMRRLCGFAWRSMGLKAAPRHSPNRNGGR